MAVPDSLSTWQEFVAQQIREPEDLSLEEIANLSDEEKEDFDQSRYAYIGSDVVIATKDTEAVTRQVKIIRARLASTRSTAGRTLAISGRAGVGKSTIAMLMGKNHEAATRRKAGLDPDDRSIAPVVYLVVPPGCTPRMLMAAVARWIGIPVMRGWDAPTITDHVVAVLKDLKTSMLIVDEVHNLKTNKSAGSEAASALKGFTERLDAAVIFCGIDLLDSDLLAGEIGRQIRARTKVLELTTYSFATADAREAWAELVEGMEALLPLADHEPGALASDEMVTYLWHRTGGSIGSLRNLLADAAIEAIITGTEKITRQLLDATITDQEAVRGQAALSTGAASDTRPGHAV